MFFDVEDPGALVANLAWSFMRMEIWVLEQSCFPMMFAHNSLEALHDADFSSYCREREAAFRRRGRRLIFPLSRS